MKRLGWWWLVALLVVLGLALRHNLLFLMSLLMALAGGASWLWTRFCLAGVTYRRRFGARRLFYGDETGLSLEVVNAKPLPLAWLRVEDEFPAELELLNAPLSASHLPGRRLLVNLLSLRWYERVTRHYRLRAGQRGAMVLGPAVVTSGDIFGQDVRHQTLLETDTLLVYPKMVPLTALGLPARHPFGDLRTPRRVVEDPLRLMGAREYRPGDSYRHIHWKASAHRQALQTKVFDPSATRPLAIFLNVNTFEFIYEGLDRELQEFAITAAASIARFACEEGHPTGLYVNSVTWPGGQRIRIRPNAHPDQLARILEALARVVMYGRWPIDAVVALESPTLRYGTTVVVVTPRINDRLRRALADLPRHGLAATLVALGDARLDAPLPGVSYHHIGGREVWHGLQSLALAP